MASRPKIQIALATYNGERFLPAFLDSIAHQFYAPFEVVASDDASTDETLAILRDYAGRIPMRILPGDGRRGVVKNFENALASCDAPYVALADQDDVWHPEKLGTLLNAIQVQEEKSAAATPVLAFSDMALVGDDLTTPGRSIFSQTLKSAAVSHPRDFLLSNHIAGCATMLNRALIARALPFPAVCIHDWWINFVAVSMGILVWIPEVLVDYRQHPNNAIGIGRAAGSLASKIRNVVCDPGVFFAQRMDDARKRVADVSENLEALEERMQQYSVTGPRRDEIARFRRNGLFSLIVETVCVRTGLRFIDVCLTLPLLAGANRARLMGRNKIHV